MKIKEIDRKNREITKNTAPTQKRKSIDNWLSFEHKVRGDNEASSEGDAK